MRLAWSGSKAAKAFSATSYQLPSSTQSVCPVCLKVIDAQLYQQDGQVLMTKSCDIHGRFNELISSDAEFFLKLRRTHYEQPQPVHNPHCRTNLGCPADCGLCEHHLSTPIMVNIDLTNRCNMNCPICFASSNTVGRICELTLDQVKQLLDAARAIRPHPPSCLQLVGGEPTIHRDFIEAVRQAKARGFAQVQAATNGIMFAENFEFTQAVSEAGLDQVYLQFDGLSDDIYLKTRGRALLEMKLKAIENIRRACIRIILVPTLVKGLNDHEVGEITKFAIRNIDAISAISWQPVAVTGRIDEAARCRMRFTTADLARCLQEQCGFIDMHRDWYPFSVVAPFVRLLEVTTGQSQPQISCHPHCGCATYLVVDKRNGTAVPLPAFVDIEPAMKTLDKIAARIEKHSWTKKLSMLQAMNALKAHFHTQRAPQGWSFENFLEFTRSFLELSQQHTDKKACARQLQNSRFGTLLLAAMHFQDSYNYELDRSRHCVILYAAPDGRFYPFCTWNSGPCHRYRVEQAFAQPRRKIKPLDTQSTTHSKQKSEVSR
jgi:hypothetical protein